MTNKTPKAVAVVGLGSIMPEAPNTAAFWQNLINSKSSITEVDKDRWDPELYFDPDPKVPDKTYSRIGGWVRDWEWEPLKWRLPIPPKVSDSMDLAQKWAIGCARELLADYGYPERPLDTKRTGVILGNALGGDLHLMTAGRALFPEFYQELLKAPSFLGLSNDMRKKIFQEFSQGVDKHFLQITEDTMPGELSNIVPGRVAALYNFNGPNYATDAACASAMAAFSASIDGLVSGDYDAVITGGVDANNGVSTFVKFSKIGALSATGSRPYADGADGFVMGEGSALFLLKRLEDAERDGDKIYAIIRGIGASSDGKGKGITAPNPVGQHLALKRAWENAGVSASTATMLEGHGTSTAVGDLVEAQALADFFNENGAETQSVALGSVKSNIGHLKAAAGAAGMLKAVLSLHHKMLPESLNFNKPNPGMDFASSPFYVPTQPASWERTKDGVRRAGVSAFGFGGTNFHAVLEEYIPGRVSSELKEKSTSVVVNGSGEQSAKTSGTKAPLRGALVIGDVSKSAIAARLEKNLSDAKKGTAPAIQAPAEKDLKAPMRLAIDFADAADLANKGERALKALNSENEGMWRALRAKGVFFGQGSGKKVAFLYTGQGSQYVNMIEDLKDADPLVTNLFKKADEVMTPLIGKPLTDFIYADKKDEKATAIAENDLKQTEITQPAVLTVDTALSEMLQSYGIKPDMVMGHSLGEYGALVGSKALPFEDALQAVSARGKGMTEFSVKDNGVMAAVLGPLEKVKELLKTVEGYVVIANINSLSQCVIGGETEAVERAIKVMHQAGYTAQQIPVSHAFHTKIVAQASNPMVETLKTLNFKSPEIPLIANVTGEKYPMGENVVPQMLDLLKEQVSAPVQFVKGLNTLYDAGVRVFVEVGPKRVLHGFVEDVLKDKSDAVSLYTNHPRVGGVASINIALCGLYAEGLGTAIPEEKPVLDSIKPVTAQPAVTAPPVAHAAPPAVNFNQPLPVSVPAGGDKYGQLGKLFADFLEKGFEIYSGEKVPSRAVQSGHVVISGASLGLPGKQRVFDDENIARILRGEQFIEKIPMKLRDEMVSRNIHRLVKSENGGAHFESITDPADVIKLAGQIGKFDLVEEFGYPADRMVALDTVTALAIAAGVDALRDAGIPLVMRYKTTTKGTKLPDRWGLPNQLRDDTGIIFASAFPGTDSLIEEVEGNQRDIGRRTRLQELQAIRSHIDDANSRLAKELDKKITALQAEIEADPYVFDRRFLFRVLSMGHSQFAEYIGARGPNTQINSACASTTQAVGLAQDWILAGRCKRVIIIAADNITSENSVGWFGAGFLASGAAATEDIVEEVALPFDRRRHGMVVGMGGAALVVESPEEVAKRGMQPIVEVLATITANSAFHGTRLDVEHICSIMEKLVSDAESKWGIDRSAMAAHTVFVSHETYTPARGGSASAEINALRTVFGPVADQIVISNTKGFTGHPMATGIEDVLAVKSLETGIVPPVPNFKEVDPELGQLNISKGGAYPVTYALRLGAGFGSQVSMSLMRWIPTADGQRLTPQNLGYEYRIVDQNAWQNWLKNITENGSEGIEVFKRTLRIKDNGAVKMPVAASATSAKTKAATIATPIISPATQPAAAAPVAQLTPSLNGVEKRVLELIAEQTGYPTDMLDMELDLEADLGIDTVKQAEMFAAVREEYGIERDDTVQLRDFNTLEKVIGFVYDKRPDLKQAAPVTPVATPAAEPVAAPVAPIPVSTPSGDDPVKTRVLNLIAEQTGYPIDMLDMELDLEADLGIDTVKQAEMFAAVREEYNIERDDELQLREFNTIEKVIGFVYDKRPDLKQAAPPAAEPVAAPAAQVPATTASDDDPVKTRVLNLIAAQTGYPIDMLDLELDLEADLGIDTVKQAEMFAAVREEYNIERDDELQLREFNTIEKVIGFVYDKRPDLKQAAPPAAEPVAAPATQVPATTASDDDPVKTRVLNLIAAQTGYPIDMLDLELDLEADLGIDTVKQAEMFAAVREEYGIERDDELQLREFNTIEKVIGFVYDKRPDLKQVAPAPVASQKQPEVVPPPPSVEVEGDDPVKTKVLNLIAEQTGYPIDMLDLELDLEADLGIDTVKQAEMFAAVREEYTIERDDELQLREFNTIEKVIGFVYDKRPDLRGGGTAETTAPTIAAKPSAPAVQFEAAVKGDMAATKLIKRRLPTPVLRPELEMCKDSGVELGKKSRIIVHGDQGGVGKALIKKLEKKGAEVLLIEDAPTNEELEKRIQGWLAGGSIQGVFWLPALDSDQPVAKMTLADWKAATHVRVKMLYTTMRTLYSTVGTEGTFLVSATRLGGKHGYDDAGALNPLGGPVAGFTKAFKREKPEALVKAVDFDASRKTSAFADLIIAETEKDPGIVEVGYKNNQRWTVSLQENPLSDEMKGMKLDKDSVFLVTGAAGSITSAIITDLAQASGGTFFLLDLAPKPDPQSPDILKFASDKDGLKRDIFERLKAKGERATPAMVEKVIAAIEREHAALAAIQAVEAAGGTVFYYSLNLLDEKAVAKVMKNIAKNYGKIDVLLHAGGLEISRLLPDKSPKEFDLVFDVKSDGWFNMLSNLGEMPLGAAVVFSSIAGRFGNGGQTDYSSANDLLCKFVSSFKTTRPQTRGIATDWTAWGGIGMAVRGSIPTVMKAAGIDMLPPEAGIPFIRRELQNSTEGAEIVVAGSLGIMLQEFDETGGLDLKKVEEKLVERGIMTGKVKSAGLHEGLVIESTFEPKKQAFLEDHRIGGTPVLPGVMGIEAMVEAAKLLFPARFAAVVENVKFESPFKFYRDQERRVFVRAFFQQDGNDIIAQCRLQGVRQLHGQAEAQVTTHFSAEIRLVSELPDAINSKPVGNSQGKAIAKEDIYKLYFHGPAYQVLQKVWKSDDRIIGEFAAKLPANHTPEERATFADPRLIELCFQTAGIWEMGAKDRMGLPHRIAEVKLIRSAAKVKSKLHAVVTAHKDGSYDAEIVDGKGQVFLQLKGYGTMALPDAMDDNLLQPLKDVVA
ncbi:MAG: SDR family NAD(P)-dependent oxidoreductase [Calditrichaeota bacterium]|nr:MAG: SDR family NAD(P)-dependent oxidoreductase [Calditrichota bacterium]